MHARGAAAAPEIPDPLSRTEALEREVADLCAHFSAAGYRLPQLVAELDAHEFNYYHDDDGSLVIRTRPPAEEGAVVQ